jgi:hypothetical protein
MNINDIQIAVDEGLPFLIRMADGEKYEVTDRRKIALGKTRVVVIDKEDLAHVLPLLTITGISYLKPKSQK